MAIKTVRTSVLAAAAAVALVAGTASAGTVNPTAAQSVTPTQQYSAAAGKPVRGDFDGDGRDDVFWYVAGSGSDTLWSGKGRPASPATATADRFAVQPLNISGTYTPVAGDFDGNGKDDIFWYGPGSAADSIWYFTGRGTFTSKSLPISGTYTPVVGNFNAAGNTRDDIFWYHPDGSHLWSGNANQTFTASTFALKPPRGAKVYANNWRQASVSIGATVHQDLLFYVPGTGRDAIWVGNGAGGFTESALTINGTYDPIIGNFDGSLGPDMADVFWYAPGKAADSVWMNTGSGFTSTPAIANGTTYKPITIPAQGTADSDDIFWNNPSGSETIWDTKGSTGSFSYDVVNLSSFGATDPGSRTPLIGDFDQQSAVSGGDARGTITAGKGFACAITGAGGLRCWGHNADKQLGNGSTTSSPTPVDVSSLAGVTSIDASSYGTHVCATTAAGGAKCWGNNDDQQLGDGTTTDRGAPVDVVGLTSGVAAVATTSNSSCALTTSGGVKCWGANAQGQLGNSSQTPSAAPVDVTGLTSGVAAIAGGYRHMCALTTSGGVVCWGFGTSGQLGNGSTIDFPVPLNVIGLASGVASISAGDNHTCAVTTEGVAKCWGNGTRGELGNGGTSAATTPVDVTGLGSTVASISAGNEHTCAVTTASGVRCWGRNVEGQLGNAANVDASSPVSPSGIVSGISAVATGFNSTCALGTNASLRCWGSSEHGQVGSGTLASSNIPLSPSGGNVWSSGASDAGTAASTDILWWSLGNTAAQTEQLWLELQGL